MANWGVSGSTQAVQAEKQNVEDREKEVSVEKDPHLHTVQQEHTYLVPTPPCKRSVDGSVSTASGETSLPPLPRKKRPSTESR